MGWFCFGWGGRPPVVDDGWPSSDSSRSSNDYTKFSFTVDSFKKEWREFASMRNVTRKEEYEWKLSAIDTLVNTCANQIQLDPERVRHAARRAREECDRLAEKKRRHSSGKDGRLLAKIEAYRKRLPELHFPLGVATNLYFDGREDESDFSLSDEELSSSTDLSSSSSSSS